METVATQCPCSGAMASAFRLGAKIGPMKERPSALWMPEASDGSRTTIRSEKQSFEEEAIPKTNFDGWGKRYPQTMKEFDCPV